MNHPRELRWNAVYGACMARQAFDRMAEGRGAPDEADMKRFAEEAESVANMSEEGWTAFKLEEAG